MYQYVIFGMFIAIVTVSMLLARSDNSQATIESTADEYLRFLSENLAVHRSLLTELDNVRTDFDEADRRASCQYFRKPKRIGHKQIKKSNQRMTFHARSNC